METTVVATIASATVSLLAPYLKSVGEGLAKKIDEEIGSKTGETAWSKAKLLCERVKAKFSSRPDTAKIMSALEKVPDDTDTQAAVRFHLKDMMTADESFAKELAEILKQASDAGVDTIFHTTIFGDVLKLVQMGNVYGDDKNMTTEKPKPHTNIFGSVEKVVSIGTVQGSFFISTTADDEPFSKSKAFQLGYHLGALDFFVSYQKKGIPLSPLLPNWIEEAQNRCTILANSISLIVPEVPERYFDSMSEQLSAKPLVIKKCFHIGNIIGRGWFFGVSPMQAGVIPPDEFVLKRLGQAENILGEADLPPSLLATIRQLWEKAVSAATKGQFAGNDKTDGQMNQAIEGVIMTIEKYKSSS